MRPSLIVPVLGVVCVLLSLLGLTWIIVPANAAAKTSAMSLSYSDLGNLFGEVPSTWVQHNYFTWLLWVLLVVAAVAVIAAVAVGRRSIGALVGVIGVVGFVLTVFALKGQLTWSEYWANRSNLRIAGDLAFVGFLLIAITGLLPAGRRHTD